MECIAPIRFWFQCKLLLKSVATDLFCELSSADLDTAYDRTYCSGLALFCFQC